MNVQIRKILNPLIILPLLVSAVLIPQGSVFATACSGSTCYKQDPMVYTNASGSICASSAFTYTVAGSFQKSGNNGTVEVNLRYSDPTNPNSGGGCKANWSRAYVRGAVASTKQLAAKAFQTNSTSLRHTRYLTGAPLSNGTMIYSFMIDGSVMVTVVAAISGTLCSSDYGDPDTICKPYYNPNIRYSG